jgi:hypothetical protein
MMLTDSKLWDKAMEHFERADQHPHGGERAAQDKQVGALLLIAFELRRIANKLTDVTEALAQGRGGRVWYPNPPPPDSDTGGVR